MFVAIGLVACAVLTTHSALSSGPMGHTMGDDTFDGAVAVCLAVAQTAAATFVAAALLLRVAPTLFLAAPLPVTLLPWLTPRPPVTRSRDGPMLQVFRL